MQNRTIFNTPLITPVARVCFRLVQYLLGWRVQGQRADVDKCVYIAAPHTSNWDFPLMLSVCFTVGIRARWVGKHTLFPPLFGGIMSYLGGIPIDRRKSANTVEQMRDQYASRDNLELIITPEGTRSKVKEWKSGFYHIAMAADVPIVMAAVHSPDKIVVIREPFYPTGDYDQDMVTIKQFYEGRIGLRPELT